MVKKVKESKSNWHLVKDGMPTEEGKYFVSFINKKKKWISLFNFVNDLSLVDSKMKKQAGFYNKDINGRYYEIITAESWMKWK